MFSSPLVPGDATGKKNAIVQSDWKCCTLEPPHCYAQRTLEYYYVLRNPAVRILFNFIDSSIPNMCEHEFLFSTLTPA